MAEYQHTPAPVETTDRGLFDLGKNKDEEKMISSDFQEKVTVSECKTEEEKQHHSLHSSSTSSSSDDEEEGGGVDKKKKKRKEKKSIKHEDHDTEVPIEKIHVEEEKVPGQQASDDLASPPPTPVVDVEEEKKKKGILDKIKDKIPGFRSKSTSDDNN